MVDMTTPNGLSYQRSNIRKCKGFKDFYSHSNLILPFWTSVVFESDENSFRYVDSREETQNIQFQEQIFRGDYLSDYVHFKIISPWRFRENTGINFLYSQAFYNFSDPAEFLVPPGTVEYKYQHTTHIHFFMKKNKQNRLVLEAGQPLIHMTPVTEKRVIVKEHLVTDEEYKRLNVPSLFFTNIYKRMKNVRD